MVTYRSGPLAEPGRPSDWNFETASCTLFCHVSHFPSTKALSTRGRACAAGMERGERGFVAPPCFTNGTTRCANAMEKDRKYVSEEEEQNAVL